MNISPDIKYELTQYAAHLGLELMQISPWANIWDGTYSLRLMKSQKRGWWLFFTTHYEYVAELRIKNNTIQVTIWEYPELARKFTQKIEQLINLPAEISLQ